MDEENMIEQGMMGKERQQGRGEFDALAAFLPVFPVLLQHILEESDRMVF